MASRQGRPPLMIWWCEDQPSDGGRRPQRRRGPRPLAGAVGPAAGPGRRPVWAGGPSAAGQGVRGWPAGRSAAQELLDARRARRRPQPRRDAAPARPGGVGPRQGPRRPPRLRGRAPGRGRGGAGGRPGRPATSRRAPRPSGSNASTPAPPGASRTPRSGSTWSTPAAAGMRSSTGSCTCPGRGPTIPSACRRPASPTRSGLRPSRPWPRP